ncbi:MAG TPA: SAM-dependent methyltransferase, partial [Candidatus Acidoferrum sp.]|nr:SAM-dependent methyltransferase [Candidatus Acidoferrum sp.]
DPYRLSQFTRDPDGLMNAAGLSARQKEALRTGNSAWIRVLAEHELNATRTAEGELTEPIEENVLQLPSVEDAEDIVIDELDISDHCHTPLEETEILDRSFAALSPVQQPLPGSGMPASFKAGSLTIIGTGIKAVGQITSEGQHYLEQAQKVLYLVADPVTERWIKRLNHTAESLYGYYGDDKPRSKTYQEMADRIVYYVRKNIHVCAAFYGHPGIFVVIAHPISA